MFSCFSRPKGKLTLKSLNAGSTRGRILKFKIERQSRTNAHHPFVPSYGSDPESALPFLFADIARTLTADLLRHLQAAGFGDIRAAQVRALLVAARCASIGEIAARLHMTKQSASTLVTELQAAGYVKRVPRMMDARGTDAVPIERGRECIAATDSFLFHAELQLCEQLGGQRWSELRAVLDLIRSPSNP